MKLKISILGSTGSIGLSTLKIIDKKKKIFRAHIFSANKNFHNISSQIKRYKPNYFVITDDKIYLKIKKKFKLTKTKILSSFDEINIKNKSDVTISAIPGIAGLKPTIIMTKRSKKLLIANKESIICGWSLIKKNALKFKTQIVPIDSEHFSIFKILQNHKLEEIKKIYLTASGGPFLNFKRKDFKNISPADAIKHPKWKMGKKISVDSATLMNKILELIEAQKIFKLPSEKLDIVIHPNSLVHAIVEFQNGLSNFIYHETSMIIPIVNAIFEKNLDINDFLSLSKKNKNEYKNLYFQRADKNIFPVIKIKNRLNEYPSTPIIINAANEILVDQFLQKKIPFLSISNTILGILRDRNYRKYAIRKPKNINEIKNIDDWVKNKIKARLSKNV